MHTLKWIFALMWLSGVVGHGASSLVFQWGTRPSTGLVPQLWSTAIYLTRPLESSSGAIIVTVLWPVSFAKCAPSNYKVTQTPHTDIFPTACSAPCFSTQHNTAALHCTSPDDSMLPAPDTALLCWVLHLPLFVCLNLDWHNVKLGRFWLKV